MDDLTPRVIKPTENGKYVKRSPFRNKGEMFVAVLAVLAFLILIIGSAVAAL